MIVNEIYNGQGLGNQLFCYVTTRAIAIRNGYDYGIMNSYKFKCLDFLDLEIGKEVIGGDGPEGGPPNSLPDNIINYYKEEGKYHPVFNCDIREYDNNIVNIKDNSKIDGVLQSEDYFIEYKDEIKKWLKVKDEKNCIDFSSENICIVNFRGGEYSSVGDLYLNGEYWKNSMDYIKNINPNIEFVCITDDVNNAKKVLNIEKVYHFDIATDYSIINNAHYAIVSNSSFSYFPLFTSDKIKFIIAPKYWARHNISNGFWSCGYNIYRGWNYMDRNGKLFTYDECIKEKNNLI